MQGYEQLCRVQGTVASAASETPLDGLGQRGHSWGVADWDRMESARTVSAWIGEDLAVGLQRRAPGRARAATTPRRSAPGCWARTGRSSSPRRAALSTTYDDAGRQRRAGLELWRDEDSEYPRRAAGEVVCGTTFELGALRLDTAFFRWRMEGREGVGRYDLLRRA